MVYYDPRKPKPWPIKLLNKWGVTDDAKATKITLVGALLGIALTVFMYAGLLGGSDIDFSEGEEDILLNE